MRLTVMVSAAALAAIVSGHAAQAQSQSGQYGGGFIEYLVTGGNGPSPAVAGGGRRLRDDGVLPQHQAAYGYGGPAAMRYPNGDPYSGHGPETALPRPQLAALPSRPEPQDVAIGRAIDPLYERQVVDFPGSRRPGTIVIDTNAKHLFLVQAGGRAIRYGIGVGRPGFLWTGTKTISQKREWPDWTPPSEMLARRPDLPRHMEGGPGNPLGARAMYLGSSLYRIHGTNEPHTIGQAVSSGCIRMMNKDVIDLYQRTPVGTRVEVI